MTMRADFAHHVQDGWKCVKPLVSALALAAAMTLIVSVALFAGRARAAEFEGDAARGLAYAQDHCAQCHAVGTDDASRKRRAPAFRDLARRYPIEDLAESLAEGIVTAHPDMPEAVLEPEEIEDFLSYLDSIQAN
ncbi:c-type cytochrome [Roseibium aestuarii]|nr:cytochrome c [Roseibium aestuarii]